MIPTRELLPIVCTNNKHKLMLWVCPLKFLQRSDSVGWNRQTVFKIRHLHSLHALSGQLRHLQTVFIRSHIADRIRLQGVERRHQKPQSINPSLINNGTCQLCVPLVNGVETSSIYTYSHKICFLCCKDRLLPTYFSYLCTNFQAEKHERYRT